MDAGTSTCPLCGRTWLVTPLDDCGLPACGCYGDDVSAANPARPCERCSIRHALACPKMPPKSGGGVGFMHEPTALGYCRRCGWVWPCPAATVGRGS